LELEAPVALAIESNNVPGTPLPVTVKQGHHIKFKKRARDQKSFNDKVLDHELAAKQQARHDKHEATLLERSSKNEKNWHRRKWSEFVGKRVRIHLFDGKLSLRGLCSGGYSLTVWVTVPTPCDLQVSPSRRLRLRAIVPFATKLRPVRS
jgi:hypothetical protein